MCQDMPTKKVFAHKEVFTNTSKYAKFQLDSSLSIQKTKLPVKATNIDDVKRKGSFLYACHRMLSPFFFKKS